MSYIINNTSPFVNIKLTENGRMKLAKGQLNFSSWAIGDSEVNYNRESISDNNENDPKLTKITSILRPVDNEPNLKYFITAQDSDENNLNQLTSSQINTIKAIVNNKAEVRGFFDNNNIPYGSDRYVKGYGNVPSSSINGTNELVLGPGFEVGDLVLLKLTNDRLGPITPFSNTELAIPSLWFKIQSLSTTNVTDDTVVLDRLLPNISNLTSSDSCFIVYPGGEVYDSFGFDETTPYWNTNTLSFENDCSVSCSDVPVWNMNNVWCEDLAGMTGSSINNTVNTPNESYEKFGSNNFLGQKYPFLDYPCNVDSDNNNEVSECGSPGQSTLDLTKKSISIIHYTNNTISNFYGEFLYVDSDKNKNSKLILPNIMYNRKDCTNNGCELMGMTFTTNGTVNVLENTNIEYYDLYESPDMVSDTPLVVGKVFPQFKIIVFDDEEIIAAMSYKSNRNWTLPPLTANLVNSNNGSSNGVLESNKTMYLTYTFENDSNDGLNTTLPCQKYVKIYNSTSNTKDVEFRISDVGLLPYMNKIENFYETGFYAKEFKVLYQIVDNFSDRPKGDNWKVYNYTSDSITDNPGETIDPFKLELQNPQVNGFLIDNDVDIDASEFSINTSLNMTPNNNPELLQFGDERFFYGNVDTYIGATIFKTLFNLNISADNFKTTSNPTRLNSDTNPPDIRVSEIGIYDNTGTLVMIGKLSKPVKLTSGNTIMIELSIDF